MTATPEEREAELLDKLRNRTTPPDVPSAPQLWCKNCGEYTTDSLFALCPVCRDKQEAPARRLSRYLFVGIS